MTKGEKKGRENKGPHRVFFWGRGFLRLTLAGSGTANFVIGYWHHTDVCLSVCLQSVTPCIIVIYILQQVSE